MVTGRLPPEVMVTGRVSPRMVNSELVARSEEMVTEPLVAESIACWVAVEPTGTLPKFSAAGLIPSRRFAFVTPFPMTFIARGESGALLTRLREPSAYPKAAGVKITGNRTLAPGAISAGKGKLPSVKALPWTEIESMTRMALPVLESWKEKGLESPSWTLPNPCWQGSHCNCWDQTGAATKQQNSNATTNGGRHRMNQVWRSPVQGATLGSAWPKSEVHSPVSHFEFVCS